MPSPDYHGSPERPGFDPLDRSFQRIQTALEVDYLEQFFEILRAREEGIEEGFTRGPQMDTATFSRLYSPADMRQYLGLFVSDLEVDVGRPRWKDGLRERLVRMLPLPNNNMPWFKNLGPEAQERLVNLIVDYVENREMTSQIYDGQAAIRACTSLEQLFSDLEGLSPDRAAIQFGSQRLVGMGSEELGRSLQNIVKALPRPAQAMDVRQHLERRHFYNAITERDIQVRLVRMIMIHVNGVKPDKEMVAQVLAQVIEVVEPTEQVESQVRRAQEIKKPSRRDVRQRRQPRVHEPHPVRTGDLAAEFARFRERDDGFSKKEVVSDQVEIQVGDEARVIEFDYLQGGSFSLLHNGFNKDRFLRDRLLRLAQRGDEKVSAQELERVTDLLRARESAAFGAAIKHGFTYVEDFDSPLDEDGNLLPAVLDDELVGRDNVWLMTTHANGAVIIYGPGFLAGNKDHMAVVPFSKDGESVRSGMVRNARWTSADTLPVEQGQLSYVNGEDQPGLTSQIVSMFYLKAEPGDQVDVGQIVEQIKRPSRREGLSRAQRFHPGATMSPLDGIQPLA